MDVDLRCYLVTSGHDQHTIDVAAQAAAAGAGIIQVRGKDLDARPLLELTLAVADAVGAANPATKVVVNDSVEVAWAAMQRGAHVHGVHVGQSDLPVPDARALLGPEAIIGLSTNDLEMVLAAQKDAELLDYIGAGHFRVTPTKQTDTPSLGVEGYRSLVAASAVPIVAIGDVTPADIPPLAAVGVQGAAIVRAIMNADDPATVVKEVLAGYGR